MSPHPPEWPSNLSKEDLEEALTSELNTMDDWIALEAELARREQK